MMKRRFDVPDNHNLIYSFARKYSLPLDDWYGTLAIGYLRGVVDWDPQRGALATSVYYKMQSIYATEVRKAHVIKRTAAVASLDATVSKETTHEFTNAKRG